MEEYYKANPNKSFYKDFLELIPPGRPRMPYPPPYVRDVLAHIDFTPGVSTPLTQFWEIGVDPPDLNKELKYNTFAALQNREIDASNPAPPAPRGQITTGQLQLVANAYRGLSSQPQRLHSQAQNPTLNPNLDPVQAQKEIMDTRSSKSYIEEKFGPTTAASIDECVADMKKKRSASLGADDGSTLGGSSGGGSGGGFSTQRKKRH